MCPRPTPIPSSYPLAHAHTVHAGLRVYAAIIDAELDSNGFIIPGLGDAGDRAFGNGK